MRRQRSASRANERGAAMVEFVILFPFLLALAFGVWEFGRILDAQLVATNAAREGARAAARTTVLDPAVITQRASDRAWEYLQDGYGGRLGTVSGNTCSTGDVCLKQNDILVTFLNDSGTPVPAALGLQVRVTVPVKVRVFQNFLPGMADGITVTGLASMRL